jgi:hypothetical protein
MPEGFVLPDGNVEPDGMPGETVRQYDEHD